MVSKIKRYSKSAIAIVMIITLFLSGFMIGEYIENSTFAAVTTEGDFTVPSDYIEGGVEDHTFTIAQTGEYLLQLTGEPGGQGYHTDSIGRQNTNCLGALGGSASAVAQLSAGDVIVIGFDLGGPSQATRLGTSNNFYGYNYGGKGGNSIFLKVNDVMYIGAGGGGGGAATTNTGQIQPANSQNCGTFGPGTSGTAGNNGTPNGQSGDNYFNESVLTNIAEPNDSRTPGFKITLISNTGILSRGDKITTTYAISTKDNNGDEGFIFAGTTSKGTTIKKDGFYIIECSGEAHGYMTNYTSCGQNYAGRIIVKAYLNQGDYIEGQTIPGGKGTWGEGGNGGKASLITVNGVPLVGAGGSGGVGYSYYISSKGNRSSFHAGASVTTTNNSSFGSGGGGGYDAFVNGVSSASSSLPGSIGSGGVMGAPGAAGGGGAGTNYIDTSHATLLSTPNNGKDSYYIVKMEGTRDYIPKIKFGEYNYNMPNLTIVDDAASSDGTCETFTAQLPYALYEINLKGGQWGGQLVFNMMLKQGDKLHFSQILTYISGGAGGNLGGNGIIVHYKDIFSSKPPNLIAGAGGGARDANDAGSGQSGGNKTIYYNKGTFTEIVGTIGSSIFGSSGSSTAQEPGVSGTDGLVNDLLKNGANPGEGAANFLDTGYVTSYTSSPNSQLTTPTGSFSIRLVSLGTPDQIASIETLKKITDLEQRVQVLEAPIITCQKGVPFETRLNTYAHITHTAIAVDGIQVLNTDPLDGYIIVKGQINDIGYKDVIIHELKFTFHVLEEPNSSNVNVKLE